MQRKSNPHSKEPMRPAPKGLQPNIDREQPLLPLPEEQGKPAVIRCREDVLDNLCSIERSDWNINDYRMMLRETILPERPDLFERLNALIDQNLFSDEALDHLLDILLYINLDINRSPEHCLEFVLDMVEPMAKCKDFQELLDLEKEIDNVIAIDPQGTYEDKKQTSRVCGIFVNVSTLLAEKLTGKRFRYD